MTTFFWIDLQATTAGSLFAEVNLIETEDDAKQSN